MFTTESPMGETMEKSSGLPGSSASARGGAETISAGFFFGDGATRLWHRARPVVGAQDDSTLMGQLRDSVDQLARLGSGIEQQLDDKRPAANSCNAGNGGNSGNSWNVGSRGTR
ncbi:MAG TPA: hypothetical protein VGE10_05735 [Zeimonas sp.]